MSHSNPLTWVGNLDKTAFIFYQGRDSSQLHASKYIGNKFLGATTGEIAFLNKTRGIETIPREKLWLYPEIEEINRHTKYGLLRRLMHWFTGLNVIRPSAHQRLDYTPFYPQNESGSLHHFSVLNTKRSLGQATDIQAHARRYSSLVQHHSDIENVILYGVSRGAATSFSALAENQYKKVKLCIIEAPPASISALFKFYFSRFLGKFLYNTSLIPLILGRQHKTGKEHQAKAQIARFPNDVPLVVLSSRKDKTVPLKSSIKLALGVAAKRIAAQQDGEEVAPVYFLQLDNSTHNDYCILGTSEDPNRYQNFIHAVYKKHGLPHIEEYALLGEKEFKTAELTKGILKNQVTLQAKFKSEKTGRNAIRTDALESINRDLTLLAPEDRKRAINICSAMSLYYKNRNVHSLFKQATKTEPSEEHTNKKNLDSNCCTMHQWG